MKVYVSASDPSVRVPFREVALTTGERLRLYDTSGPYTDPEYAPDVKPGLPALRRHWDPPPGGGRPRPAPSTAPSPPPDCAPAPKQRRPPAPRHWTLPRGGVEPGPGGRWGL